MATGNGPRVRIEELKVKGDELVARIKQLIHEGSVRRITIKNEEGHVVFEIPLTIGAVAAVLMPMLAAVGAIAALASHYTLVVEKHEPDKPTTQA